MRSFASRLALISLAMCAIAGADSFDPQRPEAPASPTVAWLSAELAAGKLSSRELVTYFLERIDSIDRNGPALNAVIETNPEALAIADRLDQEQRGNDPSRLLHGVPILLKDNMDTADRMLTTAGSLALVDSSPERDAFVVARLREAGAVILGKTNLSEWANFRSTRSSSGWSARGGQTRNAYAAGRNPCGSSSGAAVAVAAGLAAAAIGTETDGSIVCPAALNGVVGLKPTVGLVSRTGVVPISVSQDTPGPLAGTVEDAAILLTVLAGVDPADPATLASRGRATDYRRALDAAGLKGARIGVARNMAGFDERVDKVFDEAIAALAAGGAIIVDPVRLEMPADLADDEFTLLLYEFKDGLNRYLAARPGLPDTLGELIEFNRRQQRREMPFFGQEIFLMAQAKGPLTEKAYVLSRDRAQRNARMSIDSVLRRHKLHAIVAPTAGPAWITDLVNGDQLTLGDIARLPSVAGYPHVTVPMGEVQGLPVGLSFVGTAWSEATLIRVAYSFEQATRARKPPTLP